MAGGICGSPARRSVPAITTWQYNNHAARDLDFRYIRYRDGSEELYDHRSDPNEHHNLAGDPKYASVKERLGAYMPTKNVVPEDIERGGTDRYGRKYERLRDRVAKPVAVYPNSGEGYDAVTGRWSAPPVEEAGDLAGAAPRWVELGARLVGGCCRTGPDDIRRLRHRLLGGRSATAGRPTR